MAKNKHEIKGRKKEIKKERRDEIKEKKKLIAPKQEEGEQINRVVAISWQLIES